MAFVRPSPVVARFPLVEKPSPAKASLHATRDSVLRLVEDVHVLEHAAPRAVHYLARMAAELRARAEVNASLTEQVRIRIERAQLQNERARALIEQLRAERAVRESTLALVPQRGVR